MLLDKFMEKDNLNKVRRGTPQNDPFKFQTGNSCGGITSMEHSSLQGEIKKEKRKIAIA
jgi:hypothetical protein